MKIKLLVFTLITAVLSCTSKYDDSNSYVKILTDEGDIIVKLYNETPKHTKNFLKLTNDKFYDGLIFHRVIKDFVIQGGDPETITPKPDKIYGEKDAGYTIDAEIIDTLIHKQGIIAMAREADDVNPERKSSSSQFYIVTGKVYTNSELDKLEENLNKKLREQVEKILYDSLLQIDTNFDTYNLGQITQKVSILADSIMNYKRIKFSDKQREIYTTVGGIPHLDGNYTIFGEVVEGYEVVEKISQVPTDSNDRPKKDIKFKVCIVK